MTFSLEKKNEELFTAYLTVRCFCESFFAAINKKYPSHLQCTKGCSTCCTLQSTTIIEAHYILQYLQNNKNSLQLQKSSSANERNNACLFLQTNGECTIYQARPIICITHGIPLLMDAKAIERTCPFNFTHIDITTMTRGDILDMNKIAENLFRLNHAYILLHQESLDDLSYDSNLRVQFSTIIRQIL